MQHTYLWLGCHPSTQCGLRLLSRSLAGSRAFGFFRICTPTENRTQITGFANQCTIHCAIGAYQRYRQESNLLPPANDCRHSRILGTMSPRTAVLNLSSNKLLYQSYAGRDSNPSPTGFEDRCTSSYTTRASFTILARFGLSSSARNSSIVLKISVGCFFSSSISLIACFNLRAISFFVYRICFIFSRTPAGIRTQNARLEAKQFIQLTYKSILSSNVIFYDN